MASNRFSGVGKVKAGDRNEGEFLSPGDYLLEVKRLTAFTSGNKQKTTYGQLFFAATFVVREVLQVVDVPADADRDWKPTLRAGQSAKQLWLLERAMTGEFTTRGEINVGEVKSFLGALLDMPADDVGEEDLDLATMASPEDAPADEAYGEGEMYRGVLVCAFVRRTSYMNKKTGQVGFKNKIEFVTVPDESESSEA